MESMRCASMTPIAIPHYTNQRVSIEDYVIPKGSVVIANINYVHYDEKHWKNPNDFDPTRFLNRDGTKVVADSHLAPFSVGKRYCLGQSLAEKEYFLFLANICHNYEFIKAMGDDLPDHGIESKQTEGLVKACPLYNVKIISRQK